MTTLPETLSASVSTFAARWFTDLDRHAPAGELESLLSDAGLEMVFPERTLHSLADFRDWYETVCRAYTDEAHTLEQMTVTPAGDDIEVTVVVLWRATQTVDGSRIAMRAHQRWRLRRTGTEAGFAITEYRVDDLAAI
jgi:hypothetical protein